MTQVSGGICSVFANPHFGQVMIAISSIVFWPMLNYRLSH
jgi:hypothetical protein